MLDDSVAVDGVRDGSADFDNVQRFIGGAQHEKNRSQSLHLLQPQARIGFEPRDFVGRDVADYIDLTGLQGGDARGVFLDRLVNNLIDLWRRAPITFVAANDKL